MKKYFKKKYLNNIYINNATTLLSRKSSHNNNAT
jgi:hypothetical protein